MTESGAKVGRRLGTVCGSLIPTLSRRVRWRFEGGGLVVGGFEEKVAAPGAEELARQS
jgi:hypothetical protein